jgi:hypothetical protein
VQIVKYDPFSSFPGFNKIKAYEWRIFCQVRMRELQVDAKQEFEMHEMYANDPPLSQQRRGLKSHHFADTLIWHPGHHIRAHKVVGWVDPHLLSQTAR